MGQSHALSAFCSLSVIFAVAILEWRFALHHDYDDVMVVYSTVFR